MFNFIVKKIFLALVLIFCFAHAFAEVKVPDSGSILKELPEQTFKRYEKADNAFDDLESSSEYSADRTPIILHQIIVSGNTVLPASMISSITHAYLNKTIYLADIQKMVDSITKAYVKQGYFISRAYLPKQELVDGVLTIKVIEAKIGEVSINNHSNIKNTRIEGFVSDLKLKQPIKERDLNRKILLINDLEGANISGASIKAGQLFATTDLNLDLSADSLFDAKIGLDNYGSRYTGQYRISTVAAINGYFGYGEKLVGQALFSDQDLWSATLYTKVPIFNEGLNLQAKYGYTAYALGQQYKVLEASGLSNVYSLGLSYPFIRSQNLNFSIDSNFEHKRIYDEIAAAEVSTLKKSDSLKVNLDLGWTDHMLNTSASNFKISYILGSLNILSPDALKIDSLSAKTDGTFHVLNLAYLRHQPLDDKLYLLFQLNGQWASKNLDSSEKFNFASMRAYPASEGLGDRGWNSAIDLYYPLSDSVKIYLFQDFAESWLNSKTYSTDKNNRYLASSGLGLSTKCNQFDVNTTLAWRNTGVALSDQDKSPRLLLQANWYF